MVFFQECSGLGLGVLSSFIYMIKSQYEHVSLRQANFRSLSHFVGVRSSELSVTCTWCLGPMHTEADLYASRLLQICTRHS